MAAGDGCEGKPLFPSLARDAKFESCYVLGDLMGRGAFSEVYSCKQKSDGKEFAVKIVTKRNVGQPHLLQREVQILRNIKHYSIIVYKEVLESDKFVYMVLELLTGGELFDRIVATGSYSESVAAAAVRDILEAITFLHEHNIVHRDLKPENLIYASKKEDSVLKLVDFGLACEFQPTTPLNTVCGTPGYVAPEVFEGKPYTNSVDMWAVGVITFIMLSGYEPFFAETDEEMFSLILKCDYEFASPHWDEISENAKDLVSRLIILDPAKRMTAAAALQHPWVKGTAASTRSLPGTYERLKEFNARRKLRAGVKSIIAINRMLKHTGSFYLASPAEEKRSAQA